jgi:hypothetical protein
MSLVKKAVELIKTSLERMMRGCSPEMPFADQTRYVTCIPQVVGEGAFLGGKSQLRIQVAGAYGIEVVTEAGLVTTGEESGP